MTNNLFLYVLPKQYFLINCLVQRRVTTEMFSRGQICFADTVVRVLRRKKETKTKARARNKRHQTQKRKKTIRNISYIARNTRYQSIIKNKDQKRQRNKQDQTH